MIKQSIIDTDKVHYQSLKIAMNSGLNAFYSIKPQGGVAIHITQ
ncbi:hypothetical protein RCJ22_25350 [Vibrio sp. FNV 38]|nr:hypothetical protein [Vibrio sp. FNV 38]